MSFKIIVDSLCDMNNEIKKLLGIDVEVVPLTLQLGDKTFDGDSDPKEYIEEMKKCKIAPKSAAPSPETFIQKFDNAKDIFILTVSSMLSSTYNTALIARNIFLEENENVFIHVFDSLTASAGETLIALKISELIKEKLSNLDIIAQTNEYIKKAKTLVLLEKFDNLIKSGRINSYIAKLANLLSFKLICQAEDGEITLIDKVRGYNKSVIKLIENIKKDDIGNYKERILAISHVNCIEKALDIKEKILEQIHFKQIIITEATATTANYADEYGIVVSY